MSGRVASIGLSGILLVALAVRAVNLGGQSLNTDEVNELALAGAPVATIISAADSMPPFYSLVLKSWLAVWRTDAAARWLSVAFGVAAVFCTWGVGCRLVDERAGLAAAFVTALLPLHVYYSQFVRSYALVYLLVSLALWLLLRAVDSDRPKEWLFFVLASVAGVFTHYYFAIFLAVSLLVVLLQRRSPWIGKRALAACAAIGLLGLPLLWLLPGDFKFQTSLREPRRLDAASFAYTYLSFFTGNSLGPSTNELQTMSVGPAVHEAAPWAAAIGAVIAVLGFESLRALRGRPALPILIALGILPVLLVGGLGYAGGLNYHVRFVLWCAIAVAIGLGAGIAAGWKTWHVRAAVAAFVIVSACALYNRHAVPRYQNEDFRAAAAFLSAQSGDSEPVFIVSDYLAKSLRYYLDDTWNVVELPRAGEVNHVVRGPADVAAATATIAAHTPPAKPYWLIYSRAFHGDPDGLLLEDLQPRGLKLQTELPGVAVYRSQ